MCELLLFSNIRSEPEADVVKQSGLGFLQLSEPTQFSVEIGWVSSAGKDCFYLQMHQVSEGVRKKTEAS